MYYVVQGKTRGSPLILRMGGREGDGGELNFFRLAIV